MGFPFKFKRTPGTVFYWEKNDWSRKNGYRLPIDVYMIMQWVCLITLDLGFFCFLIHFLTVYENVNLPPILETTFENLNPSLLQANNAYISPYTTWASTMNMTTIEYLNLPVRTNYNNSMFDSDEDYYYSDSDSSDERPTVWKRSLNSRSKSYSLYRKVTHKARRTWILMARKVVPNYRYRRLTTNSKRNCCCAPFTRTTKKPQVLPTAIARKQRMTRDTSRLETRENVNMEEFFATRTIRPMDGDNGSEPDYDDDMGLDLSGLDRFSDDNEEEETHVKVVNRSKAARLLDLSEEDTLVHMQLPLQPMEIPKEETALSEL
ncbi:hypothetical protein INT47_003238 [Mucor saturninus]|uniref:Uncharacterized protein n=1 Tax=Mucor saturninus TaxID=64648 RepID=A0A8H7RIH4_9FUNG|nr:hypothetical protein INT47_003238 [Mucor saturninus]